jgi:AraC family transcriptional regulator
LDRQEQDVGENVVQAEASAASAKVRVHTYHFDTPSEQTRQPNYHILTLFNSQPSGSRGFFKGEQRASHMFRFGELIFVPAGASIFGAGPGGSQQLVSYMVYPGPSRSFRDLGRAWHERDLGRCGDIRCDRLRGSMRRIGEETASPGFASDLLLDALATSIEIDLIRYLKGERGTGRAPTSGGLSQRQLRIVTDYVQDWSGGPIRAADLAALIDVSRGHFMRAFKESTGRTVHQYVEQARLDRAKALLVESSMPLKQIGAHLGFATPSGFSLAFRRATSMTPGRYRRLRGVA